MQYIKFGSKLYTNRGQIEKHFQGDYDANCEKVVHSGQGRETVTTTGRVQDAALGQHPRGDVTDLNPSPAQPQLCISTNLQQLQIPHPRSEDDKI